MIGFASRTWQGPLFALILVSVLSVADVSGQRETPKEGIQPFTFRVEIEGVNAGFFREVSGLKSETEVIEYQEGGTTGAVRKLIGVTKYPNIVLKRGFTGDRTLYDWYRSITPNNLVKVNGRIAMFDGQGNRVAQWQFFQAFPAKWSGPEFDATKNEVAIETIEIAHEGFVMLAPGQP